MRLTPDAGRDSRHPRWLRHWRGLLLIAMTLAGAGAVAQVVGPTPAPAYCYGNNADAQICRPTLDQAEAAMRADPLLKGAGDVVEHFATAPMSADTLRQQYAIMDRRAESIGVPASGLASARKVRTPVAPHAGSAAGRDASALVAMPVPPAGASGQRRVDWDHRYAGASA